MLLKDILHRVPSNANIIFATLPERIKEIALRSSNATGTKSKVVKDQVRVMQVRGFQKQRGYSERCFKVVTDISCSRYSAECTCRIRSTPKCFAFETLFDGAEVQ